jgi:hypothetical protein
MTSELENGGKDETLKRATEASKMIINKYLGIKRKSEESRGDAIHYVTAQLEYAETHPGQLEDEYGEDFQPEDIRILTKSLNEASQDNWKPMKDYLKRSEELCKETDWLDKEWEDLGNALINLSHSI